MRLRHQASIIGTLAFSALLFAGDGWRNKPPEQWDDEDVQEILNDSPWAKRVKVRYVESPRYQSGGQIPVPGPLPPGGSNPPIGVPSPIPGGRGPGGVSTLSEIVVRWQSASVVHQALNKSGGREPVGLELARDHYVIAAIGIPEMGTDFEDLEDGRTQDRLRDGARLFVGRNRSVLPDLVQAVRDEQGLTVLYAFKKSEIGSLKGEKVKLLARIGPAQLSAEFKTKDMKFQGTLDV